MAEQHPPVSLEILEAELALARSERDAARAQVEDLLGSHTWRLGEPLRRVSRRVRHGVWRYPELPVRNPLTAAASQRLANHPGRAAQPTLLCFANIRWEARYQRPQQLMAQFADNGWRVFYIVPSTEDLRGQPYELEHPRTNVTQVRLDCPVPHDYYTQLPDAALCGHFHDTLQALYADQQISHAWAVVHLAYWTPLVLGLGWPVAYDCMDDWDGFPNIGPQLLAAEQQLVTAAELTSVSARLLLEKWQGRAQACTVVRNGVDFGFFQQHCQPNTLLPAFPGPVIGYYGALAAWFDFGLLAEVARQRPDWTFVLVGDVFVDDLGGLDQLPNVRLEGPRPYAQMPLYLHHFDVCLIPFRLYNVTHAVDPVKLYEYLSAGKPVVSVPLEEIRHYGEHVYFASDAPAFVEQIARALEEPASHRAARVALARDNTWQQRRLACEQAMQVQAPKVSIIIVTHGNLALTAQCLDSVARNSHWPALQVIVVDNGSQDATPTYLAALRERMPGLEVILNPDNRGFAAANNQGLRRADGQVLLLLNNDTVVPRGWLKPLLRRLQDPTVGLVGPVTNNVGNEARVAVDYTDIAQLQGFADRHQAAQANASFDIPMLAMFCVAMRREVFEQVGELDEQFGIGLFEDDDYSRRVQAAGLRTVCVENAYIHHYGQATFKQLIATGEYQALWDRNQAYFESKWGAWQAHRPRGAEPAGPSAAEPLLPPPPPRQLLRQLYYRLPLSPSARYRLGTLYRRLVKPALRPVRQVLEARTPPADLPALAPAVAGSPDYFVWGVIDWHFRHQRPQQLAKVLASQGHRVFYVSSELLDRDEPGFQAEALDTQGRLVQIKLFARRAPNIYRDAASAAHLRQLHQGLGQLLQWADGQACVSLVNHPFWTGVAQALPDHCLVYDCMDNHEGFGNDNAHLLAMEKALLASADLTLFTSTWLEQAWAGQARQTCVVRNAADYDYFAQVPAQRYQDPGQRRIIGYYGAIAEWFDLAVVAAIAEHFHDCCILLVGADTVNAAAHLRGHANVVFTGEVPYAQLPYYLHAFDVCLLPFQVIPLTLATNPVKVYEYLSAGKPVVATDLPELQQFAGHVSTARQIPEYLAAIHAVLGTPDLPQAQAARQAFARQQTWGHRAQTLVQAVQAATHQPSLSVIVVTYNNLALTRQCLASLEGDDAVLEVIVVDNASSDGTPAYLSQWAGQGQGRYIVLNADNRGFSAANNQGLALARGAYLMLLNNDTQVMPGALRTLQQHLRRDPGIGLIGPVTDNIGNEARVTLPMAPGDDLRQAAARYTRGHCGQHFDLRTLAFFAVMMPRSTYDTLGPLDEIFGLGFFEDDDYCRRVEQAGLRCVCAEDAFIHHHLSASFDAMQAPARQALFERNRKHYETKWGPWQPHTYRP